MRDKITLDASGQYRRDLGWKPGKGGGYTQRRFYLGRDPKHAERLCRKLEVLWEDILARYERTPGMEGERPQWTENTLAMANNMIRRFRDEAGLLYGSQGKKVVVPVELRHVVKRLTETELRPGTTNNDTWSLKESDDLRDGYVVMDFLTSPYAWFVLSDSGGLICLDRKPFRTEIQTDFATNNLMVKATERYYIGVDDWRLGVGFYSTN